jgi:hypothetical protein
MRRPLVPARLGALGPTSPAFAHAGVAAPGRLLVVVG